MAFISTFNGLARNMWQRGDWRTDLHVKLPLVNPDRAPQLRLDVATIPRNADVKKAP
jgi:hypothetical protein